MVIQLQAEGIQSISDLVDFDKDSLQQLADSLCHPGGWVLAPSPGASDTFLTKIPIAPCYCQMMGQTLKEEIKVTQYNNPTKAGKYSLEDLFRASDNIPHHYPKF